MGAHRHAYSVKSIHIPFLNCTILPAIVMGLLAMPPAGYGQDDPAPMHDHAAHQHDAAAQTFSSEDVGVTEKLGEKIPLDLSFIDEEGKAMALSEFIDRPTLILPIFYYCPDVCSMMLSNLAQSLGQIPLKPGEDFRVIALSFNHEETYEDSKRSRRHYSSIVPEGFPMQEWKFLTGTQDNIRAFTESIGFRFKAIGRHNFAHPSILLAVSPNGTIIRYLPGVSWPPFDMGMALTEASKGTASYSSRRLVTYFFGYDSDLQTYTFRVVWFWVVGAILVLSIGLYIVHRRRGLKDLPGKE